MYQRAIAYQEYLDTHPELPVNALRGIGYHRYETRSNSKELYPTISDMARDFPEFALVFTEGCQEGFDAKRLYAVSYTHLDVYNRQDIVKNIFRSDSASPISLSLRGTKQAIR